MRSAHWKLLLAYFSLPVLLRPTCVSNKSGQMIWSCWTRLKISPQIFWRSRGGTLRSRLPSASGPGLPPKGPTAETSLDFGR